MHPQTAQHLSTVAINALWCLLIALTLLALPIAARQARLQSSITPERTPPANARPANTQQIAPSPVLVTLTDAAPATR